MKKSFDGTPYAIILMLLLIMMIAVARMEPLEPEQRALKSVVLTGETETTSNGTFVILYGKYYEDTEIKTKYYLYIKGVEGYRLQEIESDKLEIVETNDIYPSIKGIFYDNGKIMESQDYVAYVPIGTITEEYHANITENIINEGELK